MLLASQFVSINSEQAKNYYIYEILRSFARLSELRGGKAGITVITQELEEPAVEASGDEKQGAGADGADEDEDDNDVVELPAPLSSAAAAPGAFPKADFYMTSELFVTGKAARGALAGFTWAIRLYCAS